MASATVQRAEPAPPEIVSVTLVLSPDEAMELRLAISTLSASQYPVALAVWHALYRVGIW